MVVGGAVCDPWNVQQRERRQLLRSTRAYSLSQRIPSSFYAMSAPIQMSELTCQQIRSYFGEESRSERSEGRVWIGS